MRVLSIDVDYMMDVSISNDDNAFTGWEDWWDNRKEYVNDYPKPNLDSILFMHNLYTKALKYCHDVEFAYDHDAILYRLENENDLEIINLDHHNDVSNGPKSWPGGNEFTSLEEDIGAMENEYDEFVKNDRVMEGNWLGWLYARNKIKNSTWLYNHNDIDNENGIEAFEKWRRKKYGEKYSSSHIDNFKLENYRFDYIFVCLSPQYIPPQYWHYFTMMMISYQNATGKPLKMINRKYEITARYRAMNKYIQPMLKYNAKTN